MNAAASPTTTLAFRRTMRKTPASAVRNPAIGGSRLTIGPSPATVWTRCVSTVFSGGDRSMPSSDARQSAIGESRAPRTV